MSYKHSIGTITFGPTSNVVGAKGDFVQGNSGTIGDFNGIISGTGGYSRLAFETRINELEKALRFMLNVFEQDGLGDGAEGDAVQYARKTLDNKLKQ